MKDQIVTCIIDQYSPKGTGLATLETKPRKKTLEVVGALKGEKIRAQIIKKKRRDFVGTLLEVLEHSPARQTPKCPHFLTCGGCSFQHLSYEQQLKEKEVYIDSLFGEKPLEPILGSSLWNYRNKMEFSFSQDKEGNRFVGLMRPLSKGRVENITECFIAPTWMAILLTAVRAWWAETSLLAFRLTTLTGTLMNLTLRESQKGAQKMILLTVSGDAMYGLSNDHISSLKEVIEKELPHAEHPLISFFILVKQIQKGSPTQIFEMHISGPTTLVEELTIQNEPYFFHFSPQAFFQPNPTQAERIYETVLGMAHLTKEETLFDLYAGVASIGITLAKHVKKVIGIELNRYSGMDAKENLILNQIANYEYIIGSVEEKFKEIAHITEGPKVVIVDPPRAGLGPTMIKTLLDLHLDKLIYISCNPKTQKQDLEFLKESYELIALQPIDQFPHTPHLENVILLQRKAN